MATQRMLAALLCGLGLACAGGSHAARLYGMDIDSDNLLRIDTRTGAVEVIGNLPSLKSWGGLDFDAAGRLYVLKLGIGLFRVNADDASGFKISELPRFSTFQSFDIIGRKGYTVDTFEESLYEINLRTGAASLVGHYGSPPQEDEIVTGLASARGVLYGTRFQQRDIVRFDLATGIPEVVAYHGLDDTANLAFAEGVFWTIPAHSNDLYAIDPVTGVPKLVHGHLPNMTHITGLTAAVPEPGVLVLGLAATPLLLAWSRRRRAHA
jgi:hypothetical protein